MENLSIYIGVLVVLHLIGFICSIQALVSVRTPQGTIGWIVSLNALPAVAVPAYLVFGRSKFKGFIFARQSEDAEMAGLIESLNNKSKPFLEIEGNLATESVGPIQALEHLAKMPLLNGNQVELLVDGEATFASIFEGIDKASEYVLIQFFIIHDDDLGNELKRRLLGKAAQGVRVYFLFMKSAAISCKPHISMSCEMQGLRFIHSRQPEGLEIVSS